MNPLTEMVDELKRLVDEDKPHTARAHETKAGCAHCRSIEVVNLIRDYLRYEDDTAPQDQFGGQSRKDVEHPRVEAAWAALKN